MAEQTVREIVDSLIRENVGDDAILDDPRIALHFPDELFVRLYDDINVCSLDEDHWHSRSPSVLLDVMKNHDVSSSITIPF